MPTAGLRHQKTFCLWSTDYAVNVPTEMIDSRHHDAPILVPEAAAMGNVYIEIFTELPRVPSGQSRQYTK